MSPLESQSVEKKEPVWQKGPCANLVRNRLSGRYFARIRVNGKLIWKTLKTEKLAVARLRLADFVRGQRQLQARGQASRSGQMLFSDAREIYEQRLEAEPDLKPNSKRYRHQCLQALGGTWPELDAMEVRRITKDQCLEWAARMSKKYSATLYNNTVDTLRHVIEVGIERGAAFDNPARHVSKRRVGLKQLVLPTQEQFHALVQAVQSADMGHSRESAELIRFLAFTGCRKGEATQVKWADVDFEKGSITVRGDPKQGTKNREERVVPMIPACRELLEQLRAQRREESPEAPVMTVHNCQKAINRAVKELGIARITHHDLRHLFATRCIESGVDIPTVARWLGHKDGGGLAMRVYGHLRIEHSREMAQKVRF
jgi:integrase